MKILPLNLKVRDSNSIKWRSLGGGSSLWFLFLPSVWVSRLGSVRRQLIGYSSYQFIKKSNKSRNYAICIILIRNFTWIVLIGDIIWLVFVLCSVLFDLSIYHNKVFVICGQYGLGYNSIRDSRITSIIGPVYNSIFFSIWTRIIIPYPNINGIWYNWTVWLVTIKYLVFKRFFFIRKRYWSEDQPLLDY